ncbi:MAG: alpha-glucosidase/alpha-galactosidase [Lachnospiraceae bacterium]|nr:alpha-glucosidase/alpha-galactosidase [Lachnospiraceae bacterium]
MSRKIVFIGAGSVTFTRNLVRDLLTFPAFQDAVIGLVDIDPDALEDAKMCVQRIIDAGNYPATIEASLDRRDVLPGADGVVTTIRVGNDQAELNELIIPEQYNVSINVGDTRGPSAVFRFLRVLPDLIEIVRDIEKYCPDAIYLNYTNPMAMVCRALQEISPVRTSGLCHSVQGTAEMLARWIGAPMDEVTYTAAGINHQAHYIRFDWNGKDAIPLIRKAITERPEIYNEEQVRTEMFLHLGYYVTESSGHNSEYVWWFRKRPDLLEKYCTHGTGWNPGHDRLEMWNKAEHVPGEESHITRRKREFGQFMKEPVDLARGHEYAAYIFNAVFGDRTPFEFNGNVRNFGLIDNLPEGCCVEVPVLASQKGLEPIHVGPLPPQLALLNNVSARCEELAVEGALTGDRDKIYQACYFDPLTATMCSLAEIKEMVDKLFEAQAPWIRI